MSCHLQWIEFSRGNFTHCLMHRSTRSRSPVPYYDPEENSQKQTRSHRPHKGLGSYENDSHLSSSSMAVHQLAINDRKRGGSRSVVNPMPWKKVLSSTRKSTARLQLTHSKGLTSTDSKERLETLCGPRRFPHEHSHSSWCNWARDHRVARRQKFAEKRIRGLCVESDAET